MASDDELIERARERLNPHKISEYTEAGGVACALVTDKGNIYEGVCIDAPSGLGFCAEAAAIGAMVTAGEGRIATIVAVDWDKKVIPPCGRCREFIYQVNPANIDTRVICHDGVVKSLRDLLPDPWFVPDEAA